MCAAVPFAPPSAHMISMTNLHPAEAETTSTVPVYIHLKPGESEDYPELTEGCVIDRLSVTRDAHEEGTYRISATRSVDFHALVEHDQPDLTRKQREAWLQRYCRVIDSFVQERYDADTSGHDWSSIDVECTVELRGGAPTEEAVVDAVWNGTRIVSLANEEDPGTFGSENLSRLLRENVEATASIPDFWNTRDQASELTLRSVDLMIRDRLGKREVTDAAALAIFSAMACSGDFPAMGRLALHGFADKEELRTELREIYERDEAKGPAADRANMMFTWLTHGGDNA